MRDIHSLSHALSHLNSGVYFLGEGNYLQLEYGQGQGSLIWWLMHIYGTSMICHIHNVQYKSRQVELNNPS